MFLSENVKNEDLELNDFTANQELHFHFLMKKKNSSLHSPAPISSQEKKKNF